MLNILCLPQTTNAENCEYIFERLSQIWSDTPFSKIILRILIELDSPLFCLVFGVLLVLANLSSFTIQRIEELIKLVTVMSEDQKDNKKAYK